MKMCTVCFRQFYSPRYDPDNSMITKKMMLAYHTQMTQGCKMEWCWNVYCASSIDETIPKEGLSPNDSAIKAMELVKLSHVFKSSPTYHFCCTDSILSKRRKTAQQLKNALGENYGLEVCIKALIENNENPDRALLWLQR